MTFRPTPVHLAILSALLPALPAFPALSAEGEDPRRARRALSDTVLADGIDVVIDGTVVEVERPYQIGLHASNGGTITATDSRVSTQGSSANAALVELGGRIEIDRGHVSSQGDYAHGLSAQDAGSAIHVRDSEIVTTGNGAAAIHATSDTVVRLDGTSATAHGYSQGILMFESTLAATDTDVVSAQGPGVVVFGGRTSYAGGSIRSADAGVVLAHCTDAVRAPAVAEFRKTRVHSDSAGFVFQSEGVKATLDEMQILVTGADDLYLKAGILQQGKDSAVRLTDSSIETFGSNSNGVFSLGGAFSMDGGSITTHGYAGFALGLNALYNPTSISANRVAVETFGELGVGALALGGNLTLHAGGITTHGKDAYGIMADASSLLVSGTVVNTRGDTAHGVVAGAMDPYLDAVDVQTQGTGANGLWLYSTAADRRHALTVANGSRIQTEDGAAMRISGGSHDVRISDSTVIGKANGGDGVLLRVDALRESTPLELMIDAGAARVDPVDIGHVSVSAERSWLEGDVVVDSGLATIALRDHSRLNGALRDNRGHAVDVLHIDDSSTWQVRADSSLRNLVTTGTVSFASPDGGFKTVDVTGDLRGNGLFAMRTDLGAGQGDLLRVAGNVEGDHRVWIANRGAEPSTTGGALTIIQTEGGTGTFTLANRGQVVDVGTYRYALRTGDAAGGRRSDWSLVNTGSHTGPDPEQPETGPGTAPDPAPPPLAHGPKDLSTAANAAIGSSGAGTLHAIWSAENATLARRMGDLRNDRTGDGAWLRSFGERQRLDSRGARAFGQTVSGMQGGIDNMVAVAGGRWHIGGLAGFSYTDRSFGGEGTGRSNSFHLGAYATYQGDSGWYLDAVAKGNRIDSRFNVTATDGRSVSAQSTAGAFGASLEAGRRLQAGHGWYVEPQVQATVIRAGGDSYRASNGLDVAAAGGSSVQLRAGAIFGKRIALADASFVQPYAKLAWVQELDGKSTVRTNGIPTRTDLSGGRVEAGLGVTASLTRRHSLYADYQYARGAQMDTPWSATLGYSFVW